MGTYIMASIDEIKEKLKEICTGVISIDTAFADIDAGQTSQEIVNKVFEYLQSEEVSILKNHKLFVNAVVFNENGYAEHRSTLWTADDKDMSVMWQNEKKVGVFLKALANPLRFPGCRLLTWTPGF